MKSITIQQVLESASTWLTCNILQRFFSHLSSTQGWNIPSVMQFSRITSIETRSNHVLKRKEGIGLAEAFLTLTRVLTE